jgi:hypothetical protein
MASLGMDRGGRAGLSGGHGGDRLRHEAGDAMGAYPPDGANI